MNAAKKRSLLEMNDSTALKYGMLIFLFFTARLFLLSCARNDFSSWITTPYVITYESGFISRAFIGSIVSLFTHYLTLKAFKVLLTAVALVMLALISCLLGRTVAKTDQDLKSAVALFIVLFVSAPVSMTYLLEAHFGRLETFLLIFTLAGLICMKKPGFEWAVPILCIFALATHPGYMVTYMPGLAVPMLYEVYRGKCSPKSLAVFLSSCIIMIGLFIYFQLFSRDALDWASAEEMGKALAQRTELKVGTPMLYLEYFAPFPGWVTDYILPLVKSIALPVGTVLFVLSMPLIIIFAFLWKNSICDTNEKFLKFIYILCLASPLLFIAAAVFGIDWDRQWAPVINCQFIFLFYFIFSKEKSLLNSVKKAEVFFNRHMLILICILVFSALSLLSNNGLLSFRFFDKSVYDKFYESALSNYDYMLG